MNIQRHIYSRVKLLQHKFIQLTFTLTSYLFNSESGYYGNNFVDLRMSYL